MPRKRRRQHGGAWYDAPWNFIKSGANAVNDFAKSTKIASTALGALGHPVAATIVKAAGYGHKRHPRHGMPKMAKF